LRRLKQQSLPSGELEDVLDDLLGIRYPSPRLSSEDAAAMVESACPLVIDSPALLQSKFFQFVTTLAMRQNATLQLSHNHLKPTLRMFQDFLKRGHGSWFTHEALLALSCVLYDNSDRCSESYEGLVAGLNPYISASSVDLQSKHSALMCIANLCMKGTSDLRTCYQALFPAICGVIDEHYAAFQRVAETVNSGNKDGASSNGSATEKENILIIKIFAAALKAMLHMVPNDKNNVQQEHLERVVSKVSGVVNTVVDWEAPVDDCESMDGSVRYDTDTDLETDDDAFSQTTETFNVNNLLKCLRKTRNNALGCIRAVTKTNPQIVLQCGWNTFLPAGSRVGYQNEDFREGPATGGNFPISTDRTGIDDGQHLHQPTCLLSLVLYDSSSQIRSNAATAIVGFLECKPFKQFSANLKGLHDAEHVDFSRCTEPCLPTIGDVLSTLHALHEGLLYAIRTEDNVTALSHTIKCFGSLVQITPYRIMNKEFSTVLRLAMSEFQFLMFSSDQMIRSNAVFALGLVVLNMDQLSFKGWNDICSFLQEEGGCKHNEVQIAEREKAFTSFHGGIKSRPGPDGSSGTSKLVRQVPSRHRRNSIDRRQISSKWDFLAADSSSSFMDHLLDGGSFVQVGDFLKMAQANRYTSFTSSLLVGHRQDCLYLLCKVPPPPPRSPFLT
jgi:hypothetical protein